MTRGRASWMYVMVPVRAAAAKGIDVAPHLKACGIDLEVPDPKSAWYPYEAAQALWERLAEAAADPTFGLTATALQNDDATSWGVIEYVARNSTSFGDALGRIARYGQLMHDHATVELRTDPAGGFFTYRIPEGPQGPNRFGSEWAAASWVLRGRKFVEGAFDPLEVTFRHAAPADTTKYTELFRCPVRFGCPETGVLVSHADLARKMKGADVALLAVVDGHARELIANLPPKTLDSQVRTYLAKALTTGGDSSLNAIASALALSTRTLQRRLQDDGLSLRDMVDEIRQELAHRMVTHTQLTNNEMTFLLGFAEAPAFLRAFKRWTGQTPGELRGRSGDQPMSGSIPQYLPGKPLRFIDELQGDPIGMFMNMLEAHGDLCEVKVGHLQGLFVFEASAVERVLVGNYKNYKTKESRSYGPLQKFLGEGLVTSEGELHLSQRRMLQPAFHRDRIAGFFDTMLQHANQLVAQWRPASVSGDFVDVSERICEMTLAIIGETMFDADLRPDAARIASAVRAVASRFHWTSTTLLPLAELWPTEKNLEARRAKAFLDEQVDALVERRRQRPPGDDLLGLLLDANAAQQTSASVMRDEVLSMVVAGHETTAVELGWILWLLSTHPEVLEQVEAELDAVLGDAPITLEKTRELPVLNRTLQEVLRLYPAVWALAREAEAADELCGFPIAAGSRVFFSPFAVHRNPKYWDNPEGFDPDRFLPERSVGRPKFAYFPFSGGQRKCIGDQFTMLELTTVLATVLRAYRFELKEGHEAVPSPNVTLPMRDPLPMRLIPR